MDKVPTERSNEDEDYCLLSPKIFARTRMEKKKYSTAEKFNTKRRDTLSDTLSTVSLDSGVGKV